MKQDEQAGPDATSMISPLDGTPEMPKEIPLCGLGGVMNYLSPAKILKGTALLALCVSSCMFAAAQKADSKQITDLFSEIKAHASLAEDDAQTLEAYARSSMSWQSHVHRLNLIKEHVDELLSDYNEMARLRDEGSRWQQEAIDQLSPLMKGMADHLSATIKYQNDHPTHINFEPWREYVRANSLYATKASSLIHDLVDYRAAKSTAESLEKQLNLQANAK
jgi:hypothetical protein